MTSRVRRIAAGIVLAVALGLLIGAVSTDWLSGDSKEADRATPTATSPATTDPHPLGTGPTPSAVKTMVFERTYSECASTPAELLASKYHAADTSDKVIAAVVARAWASYFKAGPDALPDGRAGCLQALNEEG